MLYCNLRYLFQTYNLSSILDVAIIEGKLELAAWVIDVFQREKGKITLPERFYFPSELSFFTISDGKIRRKWKKSSPKSPSFANKKLIFKTMINSKTSISTMDLAKLFRIKEIKVLFEKVQESVVSKQQGNCNST